MRVQSRRCLKLGAGRCVVGAGADADIVIDDSTVSRKHVALELCPEGVAVTHLESRNGTFYLGQRVEKITLSLGTRIKVGGTASIVIDAGTTRAFAAPRSSPTTNIAASSVDRSVMRRLFALLARLEAFGSSTCS